MELKNAGFILSLSFSIACTQHTDCFKVTPEIMVEKPISPLLYSNFIELGYGIQVEPMWGEMLFNRSFEPFSPYKEINKVWFDLCKNKACSEFITDWTGEDWYHSGYEHNAWFAAPGFGGPLPIDDSSTFFINENLQSPVKLEQRKGGIHGEQYLFAKNSGEDWGGIAQEGKFLNANNTYLFSGHFKALKAPLKIEIRVYPEGKWEDPLHQIPILINTKAEFEKLEIRFTNHDYTGMATLAIWIPPGSELNIDALSLMPAHTIRGWRPEAIACANRVNPGVIRFPGGCFASFYNWRDGIGPHDTRKPQPSYFWGGLNYNDVGVAELVQFAKAANAQMMYCLNVFHPLKEEWDHRWDDGTGTKMGFEFPEFTDVEVGAREAANLVAYCNLPAGTHPMADLRVSHGYPEPFGIVYWEMDNEVHRWFSHDEYARAVNVYARVMKNVDPAIKVGLVTYGSRKGGPRYSEKLEEMLEICGNQVDFLADRRGAGPGLDNMLQRLRDYENTSGRYIAYCNTEKLFYDGQLNYADNTQDSGEWVNRSYMFSKWYFGMNVIKTFMAFQRRGGDVLFVNFNNLANTHNQCVFNTPKEGAYLSASGVALESLSRSPAAWPLIIQDYETDETDNYQVQAAWSRDKQALVLYVFNRTELSRKAEFDLTLLKKTFSSKETIILSADGPLEMNTLDNPDAIVKNSISQAGQKINKSLQVEAGPYSFVQVILK
ncbi:MAG: hypothetical protein KAR19_11405 [Bacteroidales bacterium]|nr:hypothetical protein [Bacteroidales bacterium]